MTYKTKLRTLQTYLVQFQRHLIAHNHQVVVIFEGRDASGKDGVIKRITEHLSPRETRVVALPAPSDRDRRSWYFQRYVDQLPATQEMVLFNRSWYNRAGVERVMGFCSDAEYAAFIEAIPGFEKMLTHSGMQILKYYLDISRKEQERRLKDRANNPLKQWKTSPIDAQALEKWTDYSKARDDMLASTHSDHAPWIIVDADDKKSARLNIIRDLLGRVDCPELDIHWQKPDRSIIRIYDTEQSGSFLHY